MTIIRAKQAFLTTGWHRNVIIDSDSKGVIRAVTCDCATLGSDAHEVVIPALANVHSHAFQRALAGFAEVRGATQDDFWSWRKLMYALSAKLTPAQMKVIASQLFIEMLKTGTTHVGEFHYLHKSAGDDSGLAMAEALVEAARATGIGLTLLPVLYSRAGFDGSRPEPHQRRFALSVADYFVASCSACHGANREGLVGPALTPGSLVEADEFYFETIKNGRPGTAMPPWGAQGLTDDDINALVQWIKNVEP